MQKHHTLQIGIFYALEEILKDVSRAKFTPTWSCGCAWWWTITWNNAHGRTEISQVLISVTSVVHKILLQVWQSYKSIHRGPQTESITKYTHTFITGHCFPFWVHAIGRWTLPEAAVTDFLRSHTQQSPIVLKFQGHLGINTITTAISFLQTRRNHMVWNCTAHGEVGSWDETQKVMATKLTILTQQTVIL